MSVKQYFDLCVSLGIIDCKYVTPDVEEKICQLFYDLKMGEIYISGISYENTKYLTMSNRRINHEQMKRFIYSTKNFLEKNKQLPLYDVKNPKYYTNMDGKRFIKTPTDVYYQKLRAMAMQHIGRIIEKQRQIDDEFDALYYE